MWKTDPRLNNCYPDEKILLYGISLSTGGRRKFDMSKYFLSLLTAAIALAMSCSSGSVIEPEITPVREVLLSQGTDLLSYHTVLIDAENLTADVVPLRSAEFTANVVSLLNGAPGGVSVQVNGVNPIDVDVTITHPLANEGYRGYDVRGVFMSSGSGILSYDAGVRYPVEGMDPVLLNSDGYTRWFNFSEFVNPGLFGYTQGNLATAGFAGDATVNGYKYYADTLAATDSAAEHITSGSDNVGVFLHGTSNTRNYLIDFAGGPLTFGYAVIADWTSTDESDHHRMQERRKRWL